MAKQSRWTYMLRLPGRTPEQMPMERLAEYMREFALLLGTENCPHFAGIRRKSTGLRAWIPQKCRQNTWKRVQTAKHQPDSRPARHLRNIEILLGEDQLGAAELKDEGENVIYLFRPVERDEVTSFTVKQEGEVDGVVTGIVGADETMHLHLRDHLSRDLKLIVRNEALARELLSHFRAGYLRLRVHGAWTRTSAGWIPESNRCTVDGFEVLDDAPASEVMARFGAVPGNGWRDVEDPMTLWRDIRGIGHD